ncbi:MAG: MFS transporter [Actinomycetaceae bacterium]|nr:MFS transporter [Actinomycetaceae bacterium]
MKTFASLSYRNYRLWFLASIFANVGTWMQRVAQDWVVLTELTHNSSTAVGITTALQFLPMLLFGAHAGVLADRLDRRKLLLSTQATMCGLAVIMAILLITGHAQLWHLYALAFLNGIVTAVDLPARQVFISTLVPSGMLANAIGLNSTSFNLARLVGPAVAGVAVAVVGPGWVFLLNAASFVFPVIAMLIIKEKHGTQKRAENKKGMVREGLRYIKNRTDIIVIMVVASVVSMLGLNFAVTIAAMARVEFGRDASAYGFLSSMMAIGTLAGSLLAARRTNPRVRTVIGATIMFSIFEGACALAPGYWSFALILVPTGVFVLTILTGANAALQMYTEPSKRGRVLAIYQMLNLGATPIGAPLIGWVAETVSPRWSLGVGAIGSLLVALIAGAWALRRWNVQVQFSVERPFFDTVGPRELAEERRHETEPKK